AAGALAVGAVAATAILVAPLATTAGPSPRAGVGIIRPDLGSGAADAAAAAPGTASARLLSRWQRAAAHAHPGRPGVRWQRTAAADYRCAARSSAALNPPCR